MSNNLDKVKIVMLKGEKGDQGTGVYDDTEVRGLITTESQARAGADAILTERVDKLSTYVTPEMFGAVGDGVTDDTEAFAQCMLHNKVALLSGKSYKITSKVDILANTIICGNYASVICDGDTPLNVTGDNVIIEKVKLTSSGNNAQYGINIETGVKNTRINDIYGDNLKYSLIMNDGENSIITGCYAVECGWDCVSNYSSAKNSTIRDCMAIRCGRHGFSTDEGANGIEFINCYAEDIGFISGEGHSCFHLEGASNSKVLNCKALYTQNHPKNGDLGATSYIGLRIETNNGRLENNKVDGLEIVYESGFNADNVDNIRPLYLNANLSNPPIIEITNLKISVYNGQAYSSYLGKVYVRLSDFEVYGDARFYQVSAYGMITEMRNGIVDLINSANWFYDARYLVQNLKCENVIAKNCKALIRGRLVNCIIKNCLFESCETSLFLTQAEGNSTLKSSDNCIIDNIFSNLTNGITLGWWSGTLNNIISNNLFKGTMDTLLKGSSCGCYFYDNLQSGLTYTTAKSSVTVTTAPPSLTV